MKNQATWNLAFEAAGCTHWGRMRCYAAIWFLAGAPVAGAQPPATGNCNLLPADNNRNTPFDKMAKQGRQPGQAAEQALARMGGARAGGALFGSYLLFTSKLPNPAKNRGCSSVQKPGNAVSQIGFGRCCMVVDALSDALVAMRSHEGRVGIEAVFLKQYGRVARVIARVIRDPGRAEELAVEVFLKWSRDRKAQRENAEGWLYRTAVRTGLNELRRQTRQSRYERLVARIQKAPPTPEELHAAREEQERVRLVLSRMDPSKAELLILRSEGLSYEEVASVMNLNPASVGTLVSRAQRAFRKEYLERYGNA